MKEKNNGIEFKEVDLYEKTCCVTVDAGINFIHDKL